MKKLTFRLATVLTLLFILYSLLFSYSISTIVSNALERETKEQVEMTVAHIRTITSAVTSDEILNNQERWKDAEQQLREDLNPADRVRFFDINQREIFSFGDGKLVLPVAFDDPIPRGEPASLEQVYLEQAEQNGYQFQGAVYGRDRRVNGYLVVTSRISSSLPSNDRLLLFALGGTVLLSLILVAVTAWSFHRIKQAVDGITTMVNDLSDQRYIHRYHNRGIEEIDQIGYEINHLAANLEEQQARARLQENRMNVLIDHLLVGVLLIDTDGYIQIANRALYEILEIESESIVGAPYDEVLPGYRLGQLISHSLKYKEDSSDEVYLYHPKEVILDAHVVYVPANPEQGALDDQLTVLVYDITDMRHLEKVRSDFIANASHELKTPMTAIRGFAETLLDGAVDDPATAREFVEIINQESARISSLMSDILDLAKIEQGQGVHTPEPLELSALLNDVTGQLTPLATEHEVTLHVDAPAAPIHFIGEQGRLNQILSNLITNAVKYNHAGGHVWISGRATDNGEYIMLIVKDDGMGIPEADVPRIFERFYRVDKDRSTKTGGTGLGLSIVRNLVEGMDGTIDVTSSLGEGSTFTVYIPQRPSYYIAPDDAPEPDDEEDEDEDDDYEM